MLINMALKRVVDFHGHLCPDLVLGGKVSEYIQKLWSAQTRSRGNLSIVAENCTSALDAIQIMLGTTIGNQRLMILDFGKHNYSVFFKQAAKGYRLSLRPQEYADEAVYQKLEKMVDQRSDRSTVMAFQKIIDDRVKYLLNRSVEELYAEQKIALERPPSETAGVYLVCQDCGEQVLKSRSIHFHGKTYCMPCFQRINNGCVYNSWQ